MFFKKKIIACTIGIMAFSVSSPSFSIIPNTDYANLGQSIVNSSQELLDSQMWQEIAKSIMEQAGGLAELSIDNENNAWSNVIVRQGATRQEVQNIEVIKMSTPAFNSEKTLGMSISVYCNEGSEVAEKEASDKNYVTAEEARIIEENGGEAETFANHMDDVIERFNGGEGVCQNISEDHKESAINPKPLISDTTDEESLSPDAEQSIYDYIDIVSPPYVPTYRDRVVGEESNDNLKVKNAELEALYSFPRVMLLKLMSKRSVTNSETGLSEITTISEFASQHYGNGSSSNSNVSGKIMLSNLAVPSVVWRNLAVLKAFQVHMAVLKFKANLDKEANIAVNLALEYRKEELNLTKQE